MQNNGKTWLIVILVLALLYCVGSCDNGSNRSGEKHQGICSHCNGSGQTRYGNECGWCDGYGFWVYYD